MELNQPYHPLMSNNITKDNLNDLIEFLKTGPRLTNGKKVQEFENRWSEWLGVKYSVMVNSGASANYLTLGVLETMYPDGGEIIVPTITWISDIVAVIKNGFTPVFVDIELSTLGANPKKILEKINDKTKAVFITHALGFCALNLELLDTLKEKKIHLIEDTCESYGATFKNKRLGSFGDISNFSFYFAHHLSTIEGGMVCTNDHDLYQKMRIFRSHGMLREATDEKLKKSIQVQYPELHPEFIFCYPGLNFRSTEINAVLGLSQLKNLDENIEKRNENFKLFLSALDPNIFYTDFHLEGMSNYALLLILRKPKDKLMEKVLNLLNVLQVEYRRGTAGGGNQLRQPYLKKYVEENQYLKYPVAEHVHKYGLYLGNYPDLSHELIFDLAKHLNQLKQWC